MKNMLYCRTSRMLISITISLLLILIVFYTINFGNMNVIIKSFDLKMFIASLFFVSLLMYMFLTDSEQPSERVLAGYYDKNIGTTRKEYSKKQIDQLEYENLYNQAAEEYYRNPENQEKC